MEPEMLKNSLPYKDPSRAFFSGIGWESFGHSHQGKDIVGKKLLTGSGNAARVLLLSGVHGNETEGVRFLEEFTREFINVEKSPFSCDILSIPLANPDGFLAFQRQNGNGVDLNRNMPTKDWTRDYTESKYFPGDSPASEPESIALLNILDKFQPVFIISFHSWKPMINVNGPANSYAEAIHSKLDMPIVEDIGYPTPGSLGTYAGWERNIPTITLEFERGLDLDLIYPLAREGILNSLEIAAKLV
jgi:protein MpaA